MDGSLVGIIICTFVLSFPSLQILQIIFAYFTTTYDDQAFLHYANGVMIREMLIRSGQFLRLCLAVTCCIASLRASLASDLPSIFFRNRDRSRSPSAWQSPGPRASVTPSFRSSPALALNGSIYRRSLASGDQGSQPYGNAV